MRRLLLALLAVLALPAPAGAAQTGLVEAIGQTADGPGQAKALGAGWVRLWMRWSDVEPTEGRLEADPLASLRNAVHGYTRRGVRTLVVVQAAPQWARVGRSADPTVPPASPARFGRFMGQVARALPEVAAWEVWNEPDEPYFWRGAPEPRRYASMLRRAHTAIKAAQPRDLVVTGGTVAFNYDYVRALYRHGIKGRFDVLGAHIAMACRTVPPDMTYREPNGRLGRWVFTGYRELRRLMAAHGDRKPIWLTEMGWGTASTRIGSCPSDPSRASGVSERTQAARLTHAFRCLAADPYVRVAFWFSLQDVDASTHWSHRMGLLRAGGARKPAWHAMRAAARGVRPARC